MHYILYSLVLSSEAGAHRCSISISLHEVAKGRNSWQSKIANQIFNYDQLNIYTDVGTPFSEHRKSTKVLVLHLYRSFYQ